MAAMDLAVKPVMVGKRVSDAKLAYFEGDFGRCLELCSEIQLRTIATASEVALLKARAFLRTGRPHEAEVTIRETLAVHLTLDAALTAKMLIGTARIRQGDCDEGIALLLEAEKDSGKAHFAVRSEIALCTALGFWAKRDINSAETYIAKVDPRSDIIHARALELHAWCYTARRDYRRSASMFQETVLRLDSCQARDEVIAATAVSTLAIFAAEMFDRELAEFVEARAQKIEWSSGLAVQRFTMLLHQALYYEFAGNTVSAYECGLSACELAPTVAFEVFGWAICSTMASNAKESRIAKVFSDRARDLLDTLDSRELVGEERFSILGVAECIAAFDPAKAADLLARYWRLAPADQMLVLSGDPRLHAEEILIEGVIAHARQDLSRACECYGEAFERFREIGYVRRASIAASALSSLTMDQAPRLWLAEHLVGTSNYITASLEDSSAKLRSLLQSHPIVILLTPVQRQVVFLLCLGKSNKEIARTRRCGAQTISNMLTTELYPAFGVSCRAELVSTCLRELLVG